MSEKNPELIEARKKIINATINELIPSIEKTTKEKYKKKIDKIKLKEWKLNKERKKVGYLKHRAKIDFKVKKKLKEKFGDTFFSNMKKDIKDPILTNNKFLLNGLKKT